MSTTPIHFGTDGWRAVIAEDYTFANVRLIAAALAAYVKQHEKDKVAKGVAIGYDTRFLSADFARAAAETIAAAGVPVRLSNRDCPTPAIFWAVRNGGLASGVMITASHNPPRYNGFKFVSPQGGPADKEATNAVEALLGQETGGEAATVEEFDPRPDFEAQLRRVIDFDLIKKTPGSAVCDFVHGTGRGYLDELLKECGWQVHGIRDTPDPMFGGILPDPASPACHNTLQSAVKEKGASLGLANDPDADRFGIVDSLGEYLSPNQFLALTYVHLLEHRGMSGPIARTVATTHLLDVIAEKHGQQAIETPVGFKWLGAALENQGAILCGEESGGMSMAGHLPGKDGVLADLLAAEIWALHQQPLSVLYHQLLEKYGSFFSTRIDLHLQPAAKDALIGEMKDHTPDEVAGVAVTNVVTVDGVKLNMEDGSWLLMRPSGTEPLVRVYLEARSQERLDALQAHAQSLALASH